VDGRWPPATAAGAPSVGGNSAHPMLAHLTHLSSPRRAASAQARTTAPAPLAMPDMAARGTRSCLQAPLPICASVEVQSTIKLTQSWRNLTKHLRAQSLPSTACSPERLYRSTISKCERRRCQTRKPWSRVEMPTVARGGGASGATLCFVRPAGPLHLNALPFQTILWPSICKSQSENGHADKVTRQCSFSSSAGCQPPAGALATSLLPGLSALTLQQLAPCRL
jgi:hypothetical protein